MSLPYTDEQQSIIDSKGNNLVVNAFAGTGKTTTLEGFAKARPRQKMLYIAFNRSVAEEAKARFPSNVEAKTSHALAFKSFGMRYRDKLGNPRSFHAASVLGIKNFALAGLALETVHRFLASGSEDIGTAHVDALRARFAMADVQDIVDDARLVWEAMKNTRDSRIPMPHDGYLKLYQLSNPDLSMYDAILLDEGQDTNPCLFDIFSKQKTKKVLIGDAHQNIYTFRGAMNVMNELDGERYALTSSFRFGQPVADVANIILDVFKKEKLRLHGLGGPSEIGPHQDHLQTAYLYRTNAGLFDCAMNFLRQSKRVHFVGGVDGYNFDALCDVWHIMMSNRGGIRDPFLRSFKNLSEIEYYANQANDVEIRMRVKMVKKYGAYDMAKLIERIKDMDEPNASRADAILTTAHKSKGLEWDQVVLGNDFPDLMHEGQPLTEDHAPLGANIDPLDPEEANLVYVAVTRGRKNVVLNSQVEELMKWNPLRHSHVSRRGLSMGL